MSRTKDLAASLATVPLFSRCTKGDLRTIARHVTVAEIPAGTTIVEQGDEGESFYLLLAGTADVVRDGAAINTLGADQHFGELALLDPAPRSASVIATADCQVAVLSVRMFRVIVRDLPTVSFGLLAALAGQLRVATTPGSPELRRGL